VFPVKERTVPIVTVQQSPRHVDAKRRLVAGITQAFVDAYGVRGEQVQVFIAEFDHEHWAKAGRLAVDAEA
jgi:4-oxalocrotonate tautomerase